MPSKFIFEAKAQSQRMSSDKTERQIPSEHRMGHRSPICISVHYVSSQTGSLLSCVRVRICVAFERWAAIRLRRGKVPR